MTVNSDLLPDAVPLPKFSSKQHRVGDTVKLYALNYEHHLIQQRTEISIISSLISEPDFSFPIWSIRNTERYNLLDVPSTTGGILVDISDDSVFAMWMEVRHGKLSYYAGLDYQFYLQPIIEALKREQDVLSWDPGCIFGQCHVTKAIDLGMPEHYAERINMIAKSIRTGAQAVYVKEKLRFSNCDLENGDFILQVEENSVARMADVRRFSQAEVTKVLVLRDGKEKELMVQCKHLSFSVPSKIICWGGAILQRTPIYALEQTKPIFSETVKAEGYTDLESMVYISTRLDGSPADGVLSSVNWILEIDNQKVNSLEVLLDIIPKLKSQSENDDYIRIKLIGKEGAILKVGMRLSPRFWPTWILEWKGRNWVRTEFE